MYHQKNEELIKSMALYVKEECLEGKSKETTTLVANNILDELIECSLESILEEMSDRSSPKAQPTEAQSPTSSNAGTLTVFSSIPKEALSPVSVVQSDDDDENVPSFPTQRTLGEG